MEPFSVSDPIELWDIVTRARINFAVTADAQRFLVTVRATGPLDDSGLASATPRINIILNWFEELKEGVPTGGR